MDVVAFGITEVRHGTQRARIDQLGGRKPKLILQILTAARGRLVSKDNVIEHLWGERRPRHPVNALENHVWVLRRHLRLLLPEPSGGEPVRCEAGSYRLDTSCVSLDLDRFDTLIRAADRLQQSLARPLLEEALSLVHGEVFEDEPYASWLLPIRESYHTAVNHSRLDLADVALAEGDTGTAVEQARRVMVADPLSERACMLYMLATTQRGERELAVRAFGRLREALREELRVEPLAETTAVHHAIVRGDRPVDGVPGAWRWAPPTGPGAGPTSRSERRTGSVSAAVPPTLHVLLESVRSLGHDGVDVMLVELPPDVPSQALAAALRTELKRPIGSASLSRTSRRSPEEPLIAALRDAESSMHGARARRASSGSARDVRSWLRNLAPVVLVLRDVEASDRHVLDEVERLVADIADVPVLLVLTRRPNGASPPAPLPVEPAVRISLPVEAARFAARPGLTQPVIAG